MIRKAELDDVRKIVDLLREFHSQADQPQEFNDDDAHKFIRSMVFSPSAIMMVSDNGMICGMIVPSPINSAWRYLMEFYWYAKDGSGQKLLRAFEGAGEEMGVNEIRVSHRDSTSKVGRYLMKRGYQRNSTDYARII